MKVLIFGSRKWVEQRSIEEVLGRLPGGSTLIHGDCQGADRIGGYVGKRLGFIVRAYPAEADGRTWPSAGPLRNEHMLKTEHPFTDGTYFDLAVCFHKDKGLGKGSRHMHELLLEASPYIPVEIYHR